MIKIKSKHTYYLTLLLATCLLLVGCRKKSVEAIIISETIENTTEQGTEHSAMTETVETKSKYIVEIDNDGNLWLSSDGDDNMDHANPTEVPHQENTIPHQTETPTLQPEEVQTGSCVDKNATPWG